MNKYLFIIFFTVIFTQSFAQKIQFGPELGLTIIPINKSDVELNTFKLGINGGAYIQYNINSTFGIRLDAGYISSSKTWQQTDTSNVKSLLSNEMIGLDTSITNILTDFLDLSITKKTNGNTNFSYFQIPISFVYNANKKLSFALGFYSAIRLKTNTRTETTQEIPFLDLTKSYIENIPYGKSIIDVLYPGYYESVFEESTSNKNLQKFDYGLQTSIIFKMDNKFYFRLKYQRGLVNYYKTEPNMYEVKSPKNSLTTISVGFSFGEIFEKKTKALF